MPHWTLDHIPDQSGRTALVTGANSGLGWQTAYGLARAGATVLLACRDTTRGQDAARRISERVQAARVSVVALDLADLASIRRAAESVETPLDLLVNNAGVMALPYRQTADGFEMQLGTNHLGHFALTGLLLPALTATPTPRVVTVSSAAHAIGKINFDDLQSERRYRKWPAYGQSKLANLLFTFELARLAAAAGLPLVSAAAHPGYAATNLQQAGPKMGGGAIGGLLMRIGNAVFAQSDAMGALPTLYATTMPDVVSEEYFGPDGPGGTRGWPTRVATKASARDLDTARRLWEVSESLTGVRYALTPA